VPRLGWGIYAARINESIIEIWCIDIIKITVSTKIFSGGEQKK
jgi:hypothetical protein